MAALIFSKPKRFFFSIDNKTKAQNGWDHGDLLKEINLAFEDHTKSKIPMIQIPSLKDECIKVLQEYLKK